MIEINAKGPVPIVTDEHRSDVKDGRDRRISRSVVRRTPVVEVWVEFPQGYVNLEGYAPSYVDWPIWEIFGRFVDIDGDVDPREIDRREWEVSINGDWWDWLQQAHRYQTERPYRSIIDCLRMFKGWDETDDSSITRAMSLAGSASEYAGVEMGELSDDEYDELRRDLNRVQCEVLDRDRPRAECKESYA